MTQAAKDKVQPTDILESSTISFLGERLSTPLQIEQYLTLAMNEAYQVGLKPITTEFMETVLAIGFDDLEPNLIRHGYNTKSIARLLNVRPAEVRSFLHGQLPRLENSGHERSDSQNWYSLVKCLLSIIVGRGALFRVSVRIMWVYCHLIWV
ncbi:MAG: hypothetical protein HC764_13970 [Pleurocapsa sp. CRU_1_2]|nr:hypothetical protein [Pleurocapsa sp. CRU_1_2]